MCEKGKNFQNFLVDKLTPRQFKIAKMVRRGLTSSEIALSMNISTRTVEKHREHICKRLDLEGRGALFTYLIKNGKN